MEFDTTLLNGILGAMLFAGALHVDLHQLRAQMRLILILSTVGVIVSTLLVGTGALWITSILGTPVPFIWCLVFGALISPTDPKNQSVFEPAVQDIAYFAALFVLVSAVKTAKIAVVFACP